METQTKRMTLEMPPGFGVRAACRRFGLDVQTPKTLSSNLNANGKRRQAARTPKRDALLDREMATEPGDNP
jgi:hypothetical protein